MVARSAIANAAAMEYESLDVNARACRVNRSELGCIESFTVRQNFDAVGVLDFRIDRGAHEIASLARVFRAYDAIWCNPGSKSTSRSSAMTRANAISRTI
ncbi:MAG: hypothetical protein JWN13_964 [Betaproteobacteria bacterium]|jgi:hypothetical protein|nr:hypothetical protein [Betaproteobacteria bacterium]MEA3156285.1 hypothetical protein [Betaproteobacteria bacterium]